MDWTQQAKQLFTVPKPEHFTNYRHCCECAEHDATLVAQDVNAIGIEHLGNPGSCAQARDQDRRGSYAILDLERRAAELRRVRLD